MDGYETVCVFAIHCEVSITFYCEWNTFTKAFVFIFTWKMKSHIYKILLT